MDKNNMDNDIIDDAPMTGLELDKFELSDIMLGPASKKADRKASRKSKTPSMFAGVGNAKVAMIAGGMVVALFCVYLLWGRVDIKMPTMTEQSPRIADRLTSVGPFMTSLSKGEHLKMTVQIECANTKLKKKVAELERQIKDDLMMVLTSPEAKHLVKIRDFAGLKPHIKKEVERLLGHAVENIYFSEIAMY